MFGLKNAKNQFSEENKGFECSVSRFQTRLADFKKHQTPEFLLMNAFLWFFF